MKQDKLEKLIEEYRPEDGNKDVLGSVANEAVALRRRRKAIRYKLYRLRTEAQGRVAAEVEDEFREFYEKQEGFGGWKNFAMTWDVDLDDPEVIIHRDRSEAEEWEDVVKSRFPVIKPGGKIVYPDRKVEKAVKANARSKRTKAGR